MTTDSERPLAANAPKRTDTRAKPATSPSRSAMAFNDERTVAIFYVTSLRLHPHCARIAL